MPNLPKAAKIVIEFRTYWIAGGGKAGAGLDIVTERDDCGCPAMPMSQIKGMLRETAGRFWARGDVEALFGSDVAPSPLAFVGQAKLPDAVRQWFRNEANSEVRRQLFRHVAATRIDEKGVADSQTLRRIEVAVPMTIEGRIEWRGPDGRQSEANWVEQLDEVCAATLAFGKSKSDGFGRAIARCTVIGETIS